MGLPVFFAAGTLCAQDDYEDMDLFPFRVGDNYLQVGLHTAGSPTVSFGQLGSVPSAMTTGAAAGVEERAYHDGAVGLNTRTDADGNPINDGRTDTWRYSFASQVTSGGDIAFHSYSTSSTGATAQADGSNGLGWGISVSRKFFKVGRRAELGFTAGMSLTDVNARAHGTVSARLDTLTDVYSLNGQTPPDAPYSAPSSTVVNVIDGDGNPVLNEDGTQQVQIVDTTVLLGNEPLSRDISAGAADVDGFWQIKGAYYIFRLGSTLRMPLSERFRLSVGAGAAFALVGTRYRALEAIVFPDVSAPIMTEEESDRSVWLPSYYANANAEYWLTTRTGVFLGATYQGKMDYNQTLGDRTAKVGFDNSVGFQSGVSVRF